MAHINLYVKRKLRVDRLNFEQKQILKLGTVALAQVKDRVSQAKNLSDGAAKPLTKKYAIRKNRLRSRGGFTRTGRGSGRKGVRDLQFLSLPSGRNMGLLNNYQVRSVTERRATARATSVLGRIKAKSNQRIERWVGYSPRNTRVVTRAGEAILNEMLPRLVLKRTLGGRQR